MKISEELQELYLERDRLRVKGIDDDMALQNRIIGLRSRLIEASFREAAR